MKVSASTTNALGMPLVGCGTFQLSVSQAKESVLEALRVGYRHIDCAQAYANEEGVGQALAECGLKREEYFITTKVFPGGILNEKEKSYDETMAELKTSLEKLQLEYVDLYLIHGPFSQHRLEMWKAMVQVKALGLAKHIGVSNYGIAHFKEIEAAGLPIPEANQIEIHPLCTQTEILTYMKSKNIIPIAYSSLLPLSTWRGEAGQGGHTVKDTRLQFADDLEKLASHYKVSQAKLLLRWALQHGFAILPKSAKVERIQSNFDLFEFEVDQADMKTLDDMNQGKPLAWAYRFDDFNPLEWK